MATNQFSSLLSIIFSILLIGLILFSCDKDHTTGRSLDCDQEYTFNSDTHAIQPIIQLTCAITGCHVAGEGIGDFTKYKSIESYIANGQFENRVFDKRDMPPEDTKGPTRLTDDEIDQLKCWIQSGYPN